MTLRCYHFSKQLTQPQEQTIDLNQSNKIRLCRMITFKTNNFAFNPIRCSPKDMADFRSKGHPFTSHHPQTSHA